eukprot:m.295531 g.295531  ORF g.295531 m.295531 type:complete len:75 (-) comp15855_c0_seq4:782-1006(-)
MSLGDSIIAPASSGRVSGSQLVVACARVGAAKEVEEGSMILLRGLSSRFLSLVCDFALGWYHGKGEWHQQAVGD